MDEAAARMSKRSKRFFIENMKVIFYPYVKVIFRVEMGEKLKRFNSEAICLIDLYTGRYSLARSPGHFVKTQIEDHLIMPKKIDKDEAIKRAPVEICSEIMARKRFPRIPDIIADKDETFYKPFYVVECTNDEGEYFHMLFDAVLGDFSLLDA
jgi:hypothetical protein